MSQSEHCAYCHTQLQRLAPDLGLTPADIDLLQRPERMYTFTIPIRLDDGMISRFTGYRVQFNSALGPTKGGIRFHHEVEMQEVQMLAFLMALKCSLAQLPFGGAKGGVQVDPSQLSPGELERLSRGFVRAAHKFIGPTIDIPAPDVYTTPQIMAWMADEYATIYGQSLPGVITGKPVEVGGSLGRNTSTSLGGAFVLRHYYKKLGKELAGQTVAIQGFGNVGLHLAEMLHEWGCKIVAISDSHGGVYNANGLDIPAAVALKNGRQQLSHLADATPVTNEALLEINCDILIPSALSDQITVANAPQIKAKTILEMANAPIAPAADPILNERGITVLPDILANSGGVIVSYFEWVQNNTGDYWTVDAVTTKLEQQINRAFTAVANLVDSHQYDWRTAAYAVAINRILAAERLRGRL